jgi:2'-5' RNA ligase
MIKRTFFAIDIPSDDFMAGVLPAIRNQLQGEKIKWIPSDQLHLTLKFLGDTPENTIPGIISAVTGLLDKIPVITLQLCSVGLFKNLNNPRIIWIGIKPCPPLHQVVKFLNEGILPFGFAADETEFAPHLTIGRVKEIKQREKLGKLIEKYQHESFGTVSITEILFYESILKPEGPVYLPLKRFPLL